MDAFTIFVLYIIDKIDEDFSGPSIVDWNRNKWLRDTARRRHYSHLNPGQRSRRRIADWLDEENKELYKNN